MITATSPTILTTRRWLLALAALVAVLGTAACGGGSDDEPAPAEPAPSVDAEPEPTAPPTTDTIPATAVALPDLVIDLVAFGDDGWLRLANRGVEEAYLDDVWLCQGSVHAALADAVASEAITAGSTAVVDAGTVGGLSIEGGELALYAGDACSDPEAIFGFVQWGTGGSRHEAAAASGLWPPGATVTVDAALGSIELFGDPADPEAWG